MAQSQPLRPKQTRQLASLKWMATQRPQRGQPKDGSPAFVGNSPLENWELQGRDGDPWNAVGMVAGLVGGPQQVRQEAEGREDDGTPSEAQPAHAEFYRHFLAFWRQNCLADAAAEALGRTATSPVPNDADVAKHHNAASKRVRDALFSNYAERAAFMRYYPRSLRERDLPCIGREAEAHDTLCEHCARVNDPQLFERHRFAPLREDDPSLAMMDDPFVAAWFRGLRTDQTEAHPMIGADASRYMKSLGMTVAGRSFIVTEDGLMELAPGATRVGDLVVIIAGANTPFVVRPWAGEDEGAGRFVLVGETYVHGVMGGEAVELDGKGRPVWMEIELE